MPNAQPRCLGTDQQKIHDIPGASVHREEALPVSANPQQQLYAEEDTKPESKTQALKKQ